MGVILPLGRVGCHRLADLNETYGCFVMFWYVYVGWAYGVGSSCFSFF